MRKKYKASLVALAAAVVVLAIALAAFALKDANFALLEPKGPVAEQERNLIYFASLLAIIVVVPVFVMTALFTWRYRAGNKKAKYTPDADGNRWLEAIWWLVPLVLILILSVVTWNSSHSLDPFRKLSSDKKAVHVQVVALQWKWLFIYPEERIATVNYLKFPEDVPVNFEITADAPMNSFWIPQLGGQIYAMTGMTTRLHLMADKPGTYEGVSANISGKGFAGMRFAAEATTMADYEEWLRSMRAGAESLTAAEYARLARPSENNSRASYAQVDKTLYTDIIMKYMGHGGQAKQPEPGYKSDTVDSTPEGARR